MKPFLFFAQFANRVEPVILQRGWDCFRRQDVKKLKQPIPGSWRATVRDAQDNRVQIKTDRSDITEINCTCLYSKRAICKHVISILYEIEERFPEVVEPDVEKRVPIILHSKLNLTEYNFKNYHNQNIVVAKTYIDQLISEATAIFHNGNPEEALVICKCLIREIVNKVADHPELGDYFEYECCDISKLLVAIINHGLLENAQTALLDFFIFEYHAMEKIGFALYPGMFFDLPTELSMNAAMEEKYFDFFHSREHHLRNKDSNRNPLINLVSGMAKYLHKHLREAEGIELLNQFKNNPRILNQLIEAEIKRKNFDRARQLALDDLSLQMKTKNHDTQRYKDLLKIALETRNTADVRFYAERCYWMGYNDIENYRILKNSYADTSEKQGFTLYILDKLGINRKFISHWQFYDIFKILEEEHLFNILLNLLERHPHELDHIEKYAEKLYRVNSERFFCLFAKSITMYSEIKKVRSGRSIVARLKILSVFEGGEIVAINTCRLIIEKNRNKPVMVEELKEAFPGL